MMEQERRISRRLFMTMVGLAPAGLALGPPTPLWAADASPDAGEGGEQALWPGRAPGGGGPRRDRRIGPHGAVSRIAIPTLQRFRPDNPNGAAVLIAAGGGYRFIQQRREAQAAADWMAARGVTAFILTYRLPGEGWFDGPMVPLQDAMRAMRLIRSQATELGLDSGKIGCMGFSAGGHLMGLLATRFDDEVYDAVDQHDSQSARPDFAILVYPVISLRPPFDHTWTRVEMIGRHPNDEEGDIWSVDNDVPAVSPPFFLVHARDDQTADVQHSLLLKQACDQAGVTADMVLLDHGGHGFGMGTSQRQPVNWTPALEDWLRRRDIL